MSPDISEQEAQSFGWIFERLDDADLKAKEVGEKSTEHYEQRLASAMRDVIDALEDIAIVLRDHLACHDCEEEDDAKDEEG